MHLHVEFELRDVTSGFRGMTARAGSRRRSFFEEARKHARDDLRERQREQRGPGGESWPALAASTRARARASGRRRSRGQLGRLPRAWKAAVSNEALRMIQAVGFAEVQHTGGVVGHGARLPARPFIGFTAGFLHDMSEAWQAYVLAAWERR